MASENLPPPTRFFVMKHMPGGPHDTEFSTVEVNVDPPLRCPQCGDPIGTLVWQPPYRVELELYGEAFGDLVEGPGGDLLVTERLAEGFEAEGLTGLSGFHPVEVMRVHRKGRGPKPGPPPKYLFVTVAYGHPALDMERSRLWMSKPAACSWCRGAGIDAIDGLALEAGTWSGEDVFRPRGLWGRVIVSERFMRFAAKQAMSHMALVPIEQFVWDPLGLYHPRPLQVDAPGKS